MAIFNPSAIVGAISGKIGGVIFVNGPAGRVVRHRPTGQGGRSQSHQAAARRLVEVQRYWKTLTDNQRTSWVSFARDNPVINRLGHARPLSPFQAFVRYNVIALMYGKNKGSTPAKIHLAQKPTGLALTLTTTSMRCDLNETTPLGGYEMLIYGALLQQSHLPAHFNNWRFLGMKQISAGASNFFIQSPWEAVFTLPVVGQAFAVRFESHSNYYRLTQTILKTQLGAA